MARMRTMVAGTALVVLLATGCEWHFEVLDGNGGSHGQIVGDVGDHNDAILYNGGPHVFYQDRINGDLRHGYWNGQFWAFETLDGSGGPNGRIAAEVGTHSASVLYDGGPHVFYRDDTNGNLRHGWCG